MTEYPRCVHCRAEIVADDLAGWVHLLTGDDLCSEGSPERASPFVPEVENP